MEDEAFDRDALLAGVAILDDPDEIEAMRAASRRQGRPRSADAVAELVLALARRGALPTRAAIDARSRGEAA